MRKREKKRTVLSMIAIAVVVIYYALGILALVAHSIGMNMHSEGNFEAFKFWHNKIWDNLSMYVVMVPILGAIPNIILNIVGMIKEKRVFPFLLCIILPVFIWFIVAAVATAYF